MKTYIVGKNNFTVRAAGFLSAYMLTCNWFKPKNTVLVTDCETNETRWFSNQIDRNGNHRCYCEHIGPNGKIIAFH